MKITKEFIEHQLTNANRKYRDAQLSVHEAIENAGYVRGVLELLTDLKTILEQPEQEEPPASK